MKLGTFFEKFDQFANTPDAVYEIRALLTHFAVRGKLVPSDPREAPVALTLSGPLLSDESLPSNWRCGLLGDAVNFEYGYNLPAPKRTQTGEYPVYGSNGVVGTHDTYLTNEPAIIVGRKGSAGALNIADGPSWTTDVAYFVCPPKDLDLRFTYYLLSTLRLDDLGKGIKPGLSRKEAYALPIAVPPLAEQRRIVAKVDELMALCDRLEAQQQERETRHAALARASLARFADAPTPAHLPFLFHPSYAIPPADLRKSILTLAVQGKLVPQDPNDEPAEETLRVCGVDLKRWAVAPDEERQSVPDSWTWIRFAGVGEQRLGKMLDAQKNRGELKPYLRNTNVQWMRFELDDVKDMRVEEREMEELRLKTGDLLICEGGEPGRCAIWRDEVGEMYFQKAIHRVRPCDAVTSEYLALNLQIDCANGVLAGYFTGATIKHLTGRSLAAYPVPIPPLAEQRRIVAKVEQLMALVDALEMQLAASRTTGTSLMEAVVAELTAQA